MKTTVAMVRWGTVTASEPWLTCWSRSVWREGGKSERATVCMRKRKGGSEAEGARESAGGWSVSIKINPEMVHASSMQCRLFTCKQLHAWNFEESLCLSCLVYVFSKICIQFGEKLVTSLEARNDCQLTEINKDIVIHVRDQRLMCP